MRLGYPYSLGGCSDPFQPIEKKERISYRCLEYLAETKYPFVVSTKGRLVADPEYLSLIAKCNCVIQISAVCDKYDKIEQGAPGFAERVEMARAVAKTGTRVIIRMQPYLVEVFNDVVKNIPVMADAGAYGIVFEGMKFLKKQRGLIKLGGDFCYPKDVLQKHFTVFKKLCHDNGLKFYSGENRLRAMGDSMCCCGIDGMPGFRGNDFNICMAVNGYISEPTEQMKKAGTACCFKGINQKAGSSQMFKKMSMAGVMQKEMLEKRDYYNKIFGIDE